MPNLDTESPINVLLIDDDHSDLALMGLAIEQSGVNMWLQTANDAQRAIDYLEGRDTYADRKMHPLPDLVILDLDMPLSAGFEFLDWRKASPIFGSLPVALLSGSAYAGAIEAALSMGAAVSLSKPGPLQDWKMMVEKLPGFIDENRKHFPARIA